MLVTAGVRSYSFISAFIFDNDRTQPDLGTTSFAYLLIVFRDGLAACLRAGFLWNSEFGILRAGWEGWLGWFFFMDGRKHLYFCFRRWAWI
jgi:hypothetical protein